MNNFLIHWWQRRRLKQALKNGDRHKAKILLNQILRTNRKLTWWESLFYEQIKSEKSQQLLQNKFILLEHQIKNKSTEGLYLQSDREIINQFFEKLNIIQHDQHKRQILGIDQEAFEQFELQLTEYLKEEFSKRPKPKIKSKLKEALDDLNHLKQGIDPSYTMALTPHVYFMKYFLENTYSLYLAWLFIYEHGLLSPNLKILDIASGPATTAYGLALFFQSLGNLQQIPQTHISYFSLERQANFQYRGLQFWRKYIESQTYPINIYSRFVTENILDYSSWSSKVPKNFFDIIVISHCFSSDSNMRNKLAVSYKEILKIHLNFDGFILLIIQGKKLFKMYDSFVNEDQNHEKQVILNFLQELDLNLITYQYLTSTSHRKAMKGNDFKIFANHNLPNQRWMSNLLEHYLDQKFQNHYTLDDYIILAKN